MMKMGDCGDSVVLIVEKAQPLFPLEYGTFAESAPVQVKSLRVSKFLSRCSEHNRGVDYRRIHPLHQRRCCASAASASAFRKLCKRPDRGLRMHW